MKMEFQIHIRLNLNLIRTKSEVSHFRFRGQVKPDVLRDLTVILSLAWRPCYTQESKTTERYFIGNSIFGYFSGICDFKALLLPVVNR